MFRVGAGYQEWRRLLFAHWTVPLEMVRRAVPRALDIDTFEGRAYIGLVAFQVQALGPRWIPRGLGLAFLETNVRTYVRLGDQAGVYFFSLDAASLLAVVGARVGFGLPYFWARAREEVTDAGVHYWLERRAPNRPSCEARYAVGEPVGTSQPGTLEHFLVERYHLFVQRRVGVWRVRVHHEPYPLRRVELMRLRQGLVQADGLPEPSGAPLVHFSDGVDVGVSMPRLAKR
jgi:uncharacterized protein